MYLPISSTLTCQSFKAEVPWHLLSHLLAEQIIKLLSNSNVLVQSCVKVRKSKNFLSNIKSALFTC